jgi:tetratricopeptide (TPR) repeat protein
LAAVLLLTLVAAFALLVIYPGLRRSAPPRSSAAPWSETRPPEEEALLQAVAERPGDAGAHGGLGEYYLSHGRPFEAIWELVPAREALPQELQPRLRLAEALEASSLPELAEALLQEGASPPEEDLTRRLALAQHHLRYGEADAAAQALQGVEGRLAASSEGLLVQGRVLQAQGDRTGAEAVFRRYAAREPKSAEGYYRLGRLLLDAGRPIEARAALTAGRQAVPEDARLPFYLGLTYAEEASGDGRQQTSHASRLTSASAASRARALFQEALRLAPRHALPHYQLGLLDVRVGRWGAAADHFQAATESDPSYADAYRELGRALRALKKQPYDAYYQGLYLSRVERPAEAVRAFQAVARARPDSAEGALLVSRMLIQTMQYREATTTVEPALHRFPRDRAVYERLSVLYKLTRSRGAVEQLCRQWRAALPQASEPDWVLGKLRVADGRVEEGIRLYEQALAREPERAEYQRFLGEALARRGAPGDLPRALDLMSWAVAKTPRDPDARFQLGLLLQRLGRPEEGRAQMLRALDLDPHQPPPYNSLSAIAAALRSPAQARLFAQAIRRVEARVREEERVMRRVWENPGDAEAHLEAARFRRRTGALPRAKAHLEQALALRPGWPEATLELRRVTRALESL